MSSNRKGGPQVRIRHKALYGGPFGRSGKYAVASVPCIDRGLHGVKFIVLDPQAGHVLAVDTDKREALSAARRLLRSVAELEGLEESSRPLQSTLWPTAELPVPADAVAAPKRLTRRRREVFERSQGRCFYCRTPLQPLGPWHVEHVFAPCIRWSRHAAQHTSFMREMQFS